MNPAEEREFVANNMDSDLHFILGDSGVSLSNMVAVARRFGTLRRFNALADDRAGVRTACLQDFAIPQDTPDNRAQVAAIVTAWETAQEFVAKETEIRAEAKVLGHLGCCRHMSVRRWFVQLKPSMGCWASLRFLPQITCR